MNDPILNELNNIPEERRSEEDKAMFDSLVKLAETDYWPHIKRFFRKLDNQSLSALGGIDPFKEPVTMARTQGQRVGYYMLEVAIMRERERRKMTDLASDSTV